MPILEKHNVPALFFTTAIFNQNPAVIWTDFIDVAVQFSKDPIYINGRCFNKGSGGRYYDLESSKPLKDYLKVNSWESKQNAMSELSKIMDAKQFDLYHEFWKTLIPSELEKLSRSPLVTIGGHGLLHNNIGNLNENDSYNEMKISKSILEDIIQKDIIHLAYPDGSYTRKNIDQAAEIGYKFQYACEYVFKEDKKDNRIFDRVGIYSGTNWKNQIKPILK